MNYPRVGQAVLECVVLPWQWHLRAKEDLQREHVGIITKVVDDQVTFKHYSGKIKVFYWRFKERMDGEYVYNKIMDWKDVDQETKLTLELAMKYKQSMEDLLRDVA